MKKVYYYYIKYVRNGITYRYMDDNYCLLSFTDRNLADNAIDNLFKDKSIEYAVIYMYKGNRFENVFSRVNNQNNNWQKSLI
jgi:hypothetical protein